MQVAFYARVSTEEQADRGNIENQVNFAKKYFDLHGSAIGITGYFIYRDDGVSGTIPFSSRPAASRMLADAKSGRFHALYVYRLDRLARSTLLVLQAYELLEKYNVALRSMTEMFDTSTSSGKFFMTMLASIAALERDTIVERTQLGKERAARKGRWTSGQPPFGYRIDTDGRLKVYPPEADIVKMIFSLYLDGMTTAPIAAYLNARNVPTPSRSKKNKSAGTGRWNAGQISIILRNPVYTGEHRPRRQAKSFPAIKTPAIVKTEDFEKANKLLRQNSGRRTGRKKIYSLKGIIFCGHCGRALTGNRGRTGVYYYRCPGSRNSEKAEERCPNRQLRAEKIETAIWADITRFILNPGPLQEPRGNDEEVEDLELELRALEKASQEKQAARQRVLALVKQGVVTVAEGKAELESITNEQNALSSRKEKLIKNLQTARTGSGGIRRLTQLIKEQGTAVQCLPPLPEVMRLLVQRVEVFTAEKNGRSYFHVKAKYRFSNADGQNLSNPGNAQV